jgi:hypothetical protein
MPRFYVDTSDGQTSLEDEIGIDCSGPDQAARAAVSALPDLARDSFPHCGIWSVAVRDATGTAIFRATLTLATEWLRPDRRDPDRRD